MKVKNKQIKYKKTEIVPYIKVPATPPHSLAPYAMFSSS